MPVIRLMSPGMTTFTGLMQGTRFTNGVSDASVSDVRAGQLAAIYAVVTEPGGVSLNPAKDVIALPRAGAEPNRIASSNTGESASVKVIAAHYTLTLEDNGKILRAESNVGIAVTVPAGLPEGFNVGIVQGGTGVVGIVAGSGMTKRSAASASASRYGMMSVLVQKTGEFILGGDVA